MEQATFTNMCMVCDGDRILVENKVTGGYTGIVFPGGHVEYGEPFAEAMIREVREETGLTIENPVLCGIYHWMKKDGSRYVVLIYKTDRFSGTIRSSEEGEVFWTTREEFLQMDLADGMREVLLLCDRKDLSENMPYFEEGSWHDRLM